MAAIRRCRCRRGVMPVGIALALCACSGGGGGQERVSPPPPGQAPATLTGRAMTGTSPVAGARVELRAAGNSGYGAGSVLLASTDSDADGGWTLDYSCPDADTPVYTLVSGGRPGDSGENPQLVLLAALGACGQMPDAVVVDALTTVASAFAMAPFLDGTGRVMGTSVANTLGLQQAAARAALLFDPATGQVPAAPPEGLTVPAAALNSLANLAAACADSSGGRAGDGSVCGQFFGQAAPPGGDAPTDTLQAVLDVARNPANDVAALYALSTSETAFAPALSAAPGDWLLALGVTGGGLSQPTGIAVDAKGRVWVTDHVRWTGQYDADGNPVPAPDFSAAVSEFAPDGSPLSGDLGFHGGGLMEAFGIAVDAAGRIWVTNQESAAGVNAKLGSVTQLGADGSILSGASGFTAGGIDYPQAIVIDHSGDAWIANYAGASVSELSPDGVALSPAAGFSGGGISFPDALAVDAADDVWISDEGADRMSLLAPGGAPISPDTGYAGDEVRSPGQVCVDPAGNAWVASFLGSSQANDSGSVVWLQGAASGAAGERLSPAGGYTGGGLYRPFACAIDGAGRVWIANYTGGSLSLLDGGGGQVPGAPLSGSAGLLVGRLSLPYGLAIDASGDVWVSNYGDDSLTLVLAAATPVKTPLIGPPALP